jgi:diphthamide biosynthesis protein 7
MGGSNRFSDSITPLWSGVLDAPPSCLEFVPRKHNPGFEYFIVGTYTLLAGESQPTETETQDDPPDQDGQTPKKPQEKVGGLKLFRIDNGVV